MKPETLGINAGIVRKGDFIELTFKDGTHRSYTAQEERVEPVPSNTILALVNFECRIDLRSKDGDQ